MKRSAIPRRSPLKRMAFKKRPKNVPYYIRYLRDGREICSPGAWKDKRFQVWHEQGHKCGGDGFASFLGCSKEIELADMELHHIVSRGMSGGKRDDRRSNLVGLCKVCHAKLRPEPQWRSER